MTSILLLDSILFLFSLPDYPGSFTLVALVPHSLQIQGDTFYSSHFPTLKYKFYHSMLSLPSLKYKYCLAHLYKLCLSSRESQPFFLVPSSHSHAIHVHHQNLCLCTMILNQGPELPWGNVSESQGGRERYIDFGNAPLGV